MYFRSLNLSLADLLGKDYTDTVVEANLLLGRMTAEDAYKLAEEKIDFYPENLQNLNKSLLDKVAKTVIKPFNNDVDGAPTNAFRKATNKDSAPITGAGCFRIGEDGRLYLIGKSEHYHASLGHKFNGYKLIDNARELGILNATHNNTRGYITRLLETRLVQSANGVDWNDYETTKKIVESTEPHLLII